MGNMNAAIGCGSAALKSIPAGFAARDRLMGEIQNLKDAVHQLSAKLEPVRGGIPREEKSRGCSGASSEYFQSIYDAAAQIEEIKDHVSAICQEVEL